MSNTATKLWYRRPADDWNKALPIGNGRLGGMISGGARWEHLQLNEDSLWYGGPMNRVNPDARKNLERLRGLIFEGRVREAERLIRYAFTGTPQSMSPYQTLGDMNIIFRRAGSREPDNYTRELDVSRAIHTVRFTVGATTHRRETYASAPDDCIVQRFRVEGPGAAGADTTGAAAEGALLNFDVMMTRGRLYTRSWAPGDHLIAISGELGKEGQDFCLVLGARVTGGRVYTLGEHLIVEDAREALLVFSAGTSSRFPDPFAGTRDLVERALGRTADDLEARHVAEYRGWFDRVAFSLGDDTPEGAAAAETLQKIPTDERLQRLREGGEDPLLVKNYFDFGRYLMISGSRPGSQPLTLQGIWNRDFFPPWDSKYTVNINTEMNYWPAEVCNLSECHEPLLDLVKRLVASGQKTAREMYGCRGFVCHHNTNFFLDTAPQDMCSCSYWMMGGAWLCLHLWEHYEYTRDRAFLEGAYPALREAALFFEDFLVEHEGYLVTCPSESPENSYLLPSGETAELCAGSAMDNQILRDLLSACVGAATALGTDPDKIPVWEAMRVRLRPDRVGRHGQIMEWDQDYEEADPGHRHISQLFALHPSWQITPEDTPELAAAARETLTRRLSHGGGHTGWSRAWILNMYARLHDGEAAVEHLEQLLKKSTLDNLFDNHPPFQIDGNFGGIAGIAGMLLQSGPRRTLLLPALPAKWPRGSVRGLKMRGSVTVDLRWDQGALVEAALTSPTAQEVELVYRGVPRKVALRPRETASVRW